MLLLGNINIILKFQHNWTKTFESYCVHKVKQTNALIDGQSHNRFQIFSPPLSEKAENHGDLL